MLLFYCFLVALLGILVAFTYSGHHLSLHVCLLGEDRVNGLHCGRKKGELSDISAVRGWSEPIREVKDQTPA